MANALTESKRRNWRRYGLRVGGIASWLFLCGVFTAWFISVFRDFAISSVLVFTQAFCEFPEIPVVASTLFPGVAVLLLIAAWWRPFRMMPPALLCAAGIYGLLYGIGTLCYGPPIGFRPVNGVMTLLFMAFLAIPGLLRLCGFRWLPVAGVIACVVIVALSAFRGSVSPLYSHGVRLMACGVLLAPWLSGWGLFESLRGLVLLVRHLCWGPSDNDSEPEAEDSDDAFPSGPITFRRRSVEHLS